ncbi:(2Fe-2S) ferredoxin domain-containing protein [Halorubrum amylolyticum]|uniref:(2Fe-2S) ferredoxin domain-containing protein n=1 Tax=Halorubrum amylolyticum TaxID=2508724 RepID=UPI0010091EC6|nr:(2Fe-2S) ferredoxin domain-containing protein [Halorubrum amylolyticum]
MNERSEAIRDAGFTDHVLVCTNARDSECAACAEGGASETLDAVRAWLRDRDVFWSRVHVAETGCLGLCGADGAAIAVHPRGRWFADVTPADVPALMADVFGPEATDLGRGPGVTASEAD